MSVFFLPSFRNKLLWQQAMTHSSFTNEQSDAGKHNERLEFLGDAILTFVSGAYLYTRYPERSEGDLTPIRAALVDKPQLCQFAQSLGLGTHLRLGRGAEKEGARQSERLLCSAFEALIGAYFLDCEQDVSAVCDYVLPMFETAVDQAVKDGTNAKSRLQEWTQKHFGMLPAYGDAGSAGPDHQKWFVVEVFIEGALYGRGEGGTKKEASFEAAAAALRKIESKDSA